LVVITNEIIAKWRKKSFPNFRTFGWIIIPSL